MLYKVIQYNSINNTGNGIEYDTSIVKITTNFSIAIEIAMNLKLKTKKLYKIERV